MSLRRYVLAVPADHIVRWVSAFEKHMHASVLALTFRREFGSGVPQVAPCEPLLRSSQPICAFASQSMIAPLRLFRLVRFLSPSILSLSYVVFLFLVAWTGRGGHKNVDPRRMRNQGLCKRSRHQDATPMTGSVSSQHVFFVVVFSLSPGLDPRGKVGARERVKGRPIGREHRKQCDAE